MADSTTSISLLSYDRDNGEHTRSIATSRSATTMTACRHRLAVLEEGEDDRSASVTEYVVSPLMEHVRRTRTTPFVIKSIACGAEHTLVLADDGRLFSTGSNQHGQLGRSTPRERSSDPELAPVSCMPSERIESIACGYFCSFAITVEGELWAWGDNRYGQLGIPSTHSETVLEPVMVSISPTFKVKQVSSGYAHTWVLSRQQNQLASTGNNQHGQLGTGDRVSLDGGWNLLQSTVPIEEVSCGNWVTILLTIPGDVFQAGVGPSPISEPTLQQDGTEAVSISEQSSSAMEEDADTLPLLTVLGPPPATTTGSLECVPPRRVPLPDDAELTAISSGCMCSAAVDDNGKVFIWPSDSPEEPHAFGGSLRYRKIAALSSSVAMCQSDKADA
ncbi:hypothetical protein FOZ61_006728 [Perkinsus olseni]|uniref:Uncharacterized protein n=2 Tax=Perkinsus olseni TaxID=32597 RepID=A0A7J6LBU5_PEROL|nr:hypothetical protein FOZ61_006728 [Perkinsus olseni]